MQTRRIPNTPEELEGSAKEFFVSIKVESDRGCVLVTAAFLDEALEALLRARMSSEKGAAEAIGQLFRADGALGSFSAKIELSRALGVIGDSERSDLTKIRKLRNLMAHSHGPADFSDQRVRDMTIALSTLENFESSADAPKHRRLFEFAASWLAGTLHKRMKA
jgi:DNA-binding MltR family transcriptional regulator